VRSPKRPDLIIVKTDWPKADFKLDTADTKTITLATARLKVIINRENSSLVFQDAAGHQLARKNTRSLKPVEVNGEKTLHSETVRQHVGHAGSISLDWGSIRRVCGTIAAKPWTSRRTTPTFSVPMLLSSNGYGIFWNNGSRSRFNNRFPHAFYLSSEVADAVDYYFIYGPEFDSIVAAYRTLTGAAPMFGKWAYGYWQCKNRYDSQQEILGIAHKYRELHIPLDNIVQDWFWWNTMGEMVFNKNYPMPRAWWTTCTKTTST